MDDSLMRELNSVFQDIFNDPQLSINMEMDPNSIEGWDSLTQVTLISAIQEKFDVTFEFAETLELISVADIYTLLKKKSNNNFAE